MNQRICPVCKNVIDSTVTRCQYCNTELSLSAKDLIREEGDQPEASQRVVPQKPTEKQTAPLEGTQKEGSDEFVPDWLARIRAREAAEHAEKKAEEEKVVAEKKSKSGIPDWLQSLNEDITVKPSSSEDSKYVLEDANPLVIEPVPFESGIIETTVIESKPDSIEPEISKTPEAKEDWLENLKSEETPSELEMPYSEDKSSDFSSTEYFVRKPDAVSDDGLIEDLPLDLEKILDLGNGKNKQVEVQPEVTIDVPLEEFNPFSLANGDKPVDEKPDKAEEDFFKLVIPETTDYSKNESIDYLTSTMESVTGEEVKENGAQDIPFPFEEISEVEAQNIESVSLIDTPLDSLVSKEGFSPASDEEKANTYQGAGDSDLDFSSLFSTEQSTEPENNQFKDDMRDLGETEEQTTSDSSISEFKFPFEEKPEDLPQINTQPKKIVTSELDFSDIISAAENLPLNTANEDSAISQDDGEPENELSEVISQIPQEVTQENRDTEIQLDADSLDLDQTKTSADKSEVSYPFELNALDKQIFEDLGLQPVEKPQNEPIEAEIAKESYPWDVNNQQETLSDSLEPENPVLEQTPQSISLAPEESVPVQEELDKTGIGVSVEENLFDLSELEKTLPFLDQSLTGETQSPKISVENDKETSASVSFDIPQEDNKDVPVPGWDVISDVESIPETLGDKVKEQPKETTAQPPAVLVDPFKLDDISVAPFLPEELPEWLTEVKPADQASAPIKKLPKAPTEDDGSPSPEKATLPAWLAAMRPVESVEMAEIPDSRARSDETAGQAGDVVTDFGDVTPAGVAAKPSDLSGGIKVTTRQKTNAAILSLIAANAETSEDPDKAIIGKLNPTLWRTLLAVLFIGLAILGGTFFAQLGLQPVLFPEQVVHTFDRINAISPDKTVLLVGDFEAGFAGEIRLTSQAVIEHLMRRDLNIALMSINPVDSAILSDQISRGQVTVSSFQANSKVVDLGYLPGGALAVQDLATTFSGTVPLTANRDVTSSQELLKNVAHMKDFGAIIVVTDKAETARIWVEQLSESLGDTALLIISSAQAAPLIHPYYESRQVDGVVSGLSNGLIYERILGSTGAASRNNTSLQMLSVFMAVLIMAGGFVSLVRPKMSKGKGK